MYIHLFIDAFMHLCMYAFLYLCMYCIMHVFYCIIICSIAVIERTASVFTLLCVMFVCSTITSK